MKKSAFPLRVRIALSLIAIALPMLLILLVADVYTFRSQRDDTVMSISQMARNAVEQNSSMLKSIAGTIGNYAVSSSSPDNMQYLADEAQRAFAMVEIKNWMESSVMQQYPKLAMCFVYSTYNQQYIFRFNSGMSLEQRLALRSETLELLGQAPQGSTTWQYVTRQGVACLEYCFQYNQMYYGALIPVAELDENLSFIAEQDGTFCLFWNGSPVQGGEVLEQLGVRQMPQQVKTIKRGNDVHVLIPLELDSRQLAAVVALSPQSSVSKLTVTQLLFFAVALIIILTILALYRMLQAQVTKPLDLLVDAMQRVQAGDPNYRVDVASSAPEFSAIGTTFNQMMDKIEQLTAEIYSRELEIQKGRLRNLQMQINPHFLSNCLNVIYSATVPQNWEVVRQMSAHLVSYFRFMNNLTGDEILLEEELSYTREFFAIQELRFPDKFSWEISVPDYLGKARIPPLVIKTFAENTLKHALRDEPYVELTIEAEMETTDAGSRLAIHISDTGPGFPPQVLARWDAGEPISQDGIHQIGLDNIRGRLQLAYNGAAGMQLENLPEGGCAVHISIPLNL